MYKKKWALLSVADKTGIVAFGKALVSLGFDLLATGKTAQMLAQADLNVTEVSELTAFPEILDGRVKTLHPTIHAGILARGAQDASLLAELGIEFIDLVVVNLYPFVQTIQKPGCTLSQAIEEIDIGGPTLLRAAAKNAARVTVVCDPADYAWVLAHYQKHHEIPQEVRHALATKVFGHTATYDSAIFTYLSEQESQEAPAFPDKLIFSLEKVSALRYGENPQQQAAFYAKAHEHFGLSNAPLLQGKALSFNNIADASAALECVMQFEEDKACVIVKHGNPCGVALASSAEQAYERAFASDATSAFGGIIAQNTPLDEKVASKIIHNQFVEVIVAPEVSPSALEVLKQKPALRVVVVPHWEQLQKQRFELRSVLGGVLIQERDIATLNKEKLVYATQKHPTAEQLDDLIFAWKIVKMVKSNAIVCVKDKQTIGIGAGQTSRVNSAQIAMEKALAAGFDLVGSVVASDAFFPFADSIELFAKAGVGAIIQPGGSVRDPEVIACADKHGLAMVLTQIRHFRH